MSYWRWMLTDIVTLARDRAIALTLFGGVLFYAVLYPLPYIHDVATEQSVAVVDLDNSSLSRQMIRYADASPQVKIVARAGSVDEARAMIDQNQAKGLLVIPANFRHDLLRGQQVTLSFAGDASYFLIYSAIVQGLTTAGLDVGSQLQLQGLLANGTLPAAAARQVAPVALNDVAVFNQGLGYPAYVIPGLFLLILHQTLFIGMGILGAGQWRQTGYWQQFSPLTTVCLRMASFSVIYAFLSAFYIGWCYYYYDVGRQASLGQVLLLMLPFLLATAAAGMAFSTLFVRRELPTQVMLLSSMPILFVAGFVWPLSIIPAPLVWLSQLVPAVPGMMAMLQLNQMGASWSQVLPLWLQLWGLCGLYLLLAVWGVHRRRQALAAQLAEDSEKH
ncbi:ABC transporter permease [Shewanella sp. C32]|uniref:ABC transporter permease n=1 Tax=Shewanella electrica TaxID=515560 RepID=A0ABT2FI46_9GAMM|nr:ABC transporter permease [Shewanella electrica]MCH1924101.1 ABC transporter permease [Shewanella electrica]MCS4556004.1 ABC transporter permease [Shewanella electrica]